MELNLKVTDSDIKIISNALIQMPYYQVAELIDKLNQQIQEQKQQT